MKKLITFSCPTCQVKVPVFCAAMTDEGFVILIGTCTGCGENYRFNIETILTSLYADSSQRYVN